MGALGRGYYTDIRACYLRAGGMPSCQSCGGLFQPSGLVWEGRSKYANKPTKMCRRCAVRYGGVEL